jgi:lipoate-protein ligase A
LVHGTFLLDFDLRSMEKFLKIPTKQPDYRGQRGHNEFLANLKIEVEIIRGALRSCWSAKVGFDAKPLERIIQGLLRERYQCREWNEKF